MISLGKNTARKALAERRSKPHEDQEQHQSRTGNHADPRLVAAGKTVNNQTLALGGGGQLEVTWWVD
jgi:hypothetical protein